MESGKWQFYRTISGTLAISNSNAIGITAAFCEEIQQVSPLFINFPWEIQTRGCQLLQAIGTSLKNAKFCQQKQNLFSRKMRQALKLSKKIFICCRFI